MPDAHSAADVLTFASRAAGLGDGIIRLRAQSGLMTLTSAPLAPRGLMENTPTILGMRAIVVDAELECDLIVPGADLAAGENEGRIRLPNRSVTAIWAGITPPRSGWVPTGELSGAAIDQVSRSGVAEVAAGSPAGAGEDAVRQLRARVWGAEADALDGLPAGAAFAAVALGFAAGEAARVFTAPSWTRLRFERGNVLVRRSFRG